MPISAVGNKASLKGSARDSISSPVQCRAAFLPKGAAGFTLIELLVVIALIAIGTAAVTFTLRDSSETALERDAERLAALFESARARSRASGMPVTWHPKQDAIGFAFEGLPTPTLSEQWLSPFIEVDANARVVLGPDPIIGPQTVLLRVKDRQLWVSTDGLKPFAVKRAAP